MSEAAWCTIESDPAVFTEMLERFGVHGVAVEEVVSLDEYALEQFQRVYGVVLLFKWKAKKTSPNVHEDAPVYFAQQVVSNACATQAIVNVVLNYPQQLTLGKTLTEFLDFTSGLDPHTRGELIGQSETLREVHNSFSRSNVFSFEDRRAKDDDDVYHFVSFIYKQGVVWELDGLQSGPVLAVEANDSNWKAQMCGAVQKRIAELSALDTTGQGQGISFALLAVVDDPITALETELALLQSSEQPTADAESRLAVMREQREKGKRENQRRRHNYIPCLVELFRTLAEKGKLEGIVAKAQTRAVEKLAARGNAKQ